VSRQALARPVDDTTLDGGWDRRLRSGKLVPDRSIDLHGYSRDQAYALLSRAIEDAALTDARVLLVVTGKGARDAEGRDGERPRGVIRAGLPHWLETPALRPFVAALRPAHPRHGGSGAFYVILRRRR
jgi:DNA-nicking Smr family endonuclease